MAYLSYIFFYFLMSSQVILQMSSSQLDSLSRDTASVNVESAVVADRTVLIDSTYSSNTHKEYMSRFQAAFEESDTTKLDALLGVKSWESVDLYKNIRDDIQVLGWHPFWAEEADSMYDYQTLSMVSYFGYEFNPEDGSGVNADLWKNTRFRDIGLKSNENLKFLLTVFSYDSCNNAQFFDNPEAMVRLVDDVKKMIDSEGAHGITLDFQNIPDNSLSNYTTLIEFFNEQLSPDGQMITVVIPPVNPESTLEITEVLEKIDYLIMMGYDFNGQNNKPGPFSKLYDIPEDTSWAIESGVNHLTGDLGVPSGNILVSLGWIGSLFQEIDDTTHKHKGYRSVGFMQSQLPDTNLVSGHSTSKLILDDNVSRSNEISYVPPDSNFKRTYFYADTSNFGLNLDWIQNNKLGGVAIWTLADAGNEEGYWSALAEYYGRPPSWIMNHIITPALDFFVDKWLNPFLSLYLSILIILLCLIFLVVIYYKKSIPDWIQKMGVFLPLIIFFIMLFSLSHDLLTHYMVDRWDDPLKTDLSLVLGSTVLLIAGWSCFRVYYSDRWKVEVSNGTDKDYPLKWVYFYIYVFILLPALTIIIFLIYTYLCT